MQFTGRKIYIYAHAHVDIHMPVHACVRDYCNASKCISAHLHICTSAHLRICVAAPGAEDAEDAVAAAVAGAVGGGKVAGVVDDVVVVVDDDAVVLLLSSFTALLC